MDKLIIILALILTSCKPQDPAPITYNHNKLADPEGQAYSEKTIKTLQKEEIIAKNFDINEKEDFDKPAGVLMVPAKQVIDDEEKAKEDLPLTLAKQDNSKIIYHEVSAGESLSEIAKNYVQDPEDIALLNELAPPYHLEEFQIIKITVTPEVLNKKNREQGLKVTSSQKGAELLPKAAKPIFIKPLEGTIITRFGDKIEGGKNNGINIKAQLGTPIKSISSGTVLHVNKNGNFGNYVVIKANSEEPEGLFIAYAHMKDCLLTKGDELKRGEIIGHIGQTGKVSSPQVYLAIKKGKVSVDPYDYIKW